MFFQVALLDNKTTDFRQGGETLGHPVSGQKIIKVKVSHATFNSS
jgi:hypothetical protein